MSEKGHMTDLDLPPAYCTHSNFWKSKYFEALKEIAKSNKGIRRLKNGRYKKEAYTQKLERLIVAAVSEYPDRLDSAPGHNHEVPGRWDFDGRDCEWCEAWTEIRRAVQAINQRAK